MTWVPPVFTTGGMEQATHRSEMARAVELGIWRFVLRLCAGILAVALIALLVGAIVEKLEVKQHLFRELEYIVLPDCTQTTNTSSLSLTAIASACAHPQRVAGWQLFDPVTRIKLV